VTCALTCPSTSLAIARCTARMVGVAGRCGPPREASIPGRSKGIVELRGTLRMGMRLAMIRRMEEHSS